MERFLAYAAAQVGCLYVWGAQGQTMTAAKIVKMEKTAANRKRALAHFNKHLASGETLTAYDCSGLVVKHLLDAGLINSDKNANGLYFDACDAIGKSDLAAGDLVFKKQLTQNRMVHVGIYMGDGTVVHAKGRDDGVVREAINQTRWTRFGRLKCYGGESVAQAGYTRLMKNTGRPYMRGSDVSAVQTALKSKGFSPGAIDGIYGPATEKAVRTYQAAAGLITDGIAGPLTWAALMR